MSLSPKSSLWIKVTKGIDWINQYGVVLIGLFLFVATCLWMIALDGPGYIRLPKAISHALLNRILDKKINQQIQFGLFVTQVVIPVLASGTIFTKLFHERIHPYLKRKKVRNSSDHHVIISYGGFGQALARASSIGAQQNGASQIIALDKRQFDEPDLTALVHDALQADIASNELQQHYPALVADFGEVEYWRADRCTSEACLKKCSASPPPFYPERIRRRSHPQRKSSRYGRTRLAVGDLCLSQFRCSQSR
jgi:hypothetical protein